MTPQETKAYLYRAWKANDEVKAYLEEIERIEALAVKVTTDLTGMPGTTSKDPHAKIENAAIRAADLRARIDEAEAVKLEIQQSIFKLANSNYRRVLIHRHIACYTWTQIARKMRYANQDGAIKLYNRAIKALSVLL